MFDSISELSAAIAPVIQYHKIDDPSRDARVRGGFTPPRRFKRQLTFLKHRGVVFYTASELIEHYKQHGQFPLNSVAVTLDDGWQDNYTNAFPVLKSLGIKATIFIVPSCLGEQSTKAVAEGEGVRAHLSRAQVREMSDDGIEFGSHSMNHRLLHELPADKVLFEVEEAKRQIEDLTQKECRTFAYPAGYYNEAAQKIIAAAGHIAAFSTIYGPTDRFDLYGLNRIEVLRRDRFIFQFARKLAPLFATRGKAGNDQ
ncbi:MAG TPA: polysaccharide deacetylase family protein [Pyrinomonadaceae bacterium]|nr:polysaccharide deacetylase family protein [Pyrinomonadaceae bacterium]